MSIYRWAKLDDQSGPDRSIELNPELMLNIVDNGALQLNNQQDLKLERDHIFPKKILADKGLADIADHLGNYRLIVMPINRRKKANMPTTTTDFFGRNDPTLEPLYQAALQDLATEQYLAFRDSEPNSSLPPSTPSSTSKKPPAQPPSTPVILLR
jgi:hypothetical protein